MAKFASGDTITDAYGNTATVIGITETVTLRWNGLNDVFGCYPVTDFELLPRKFRPGQFVRVIADDETYGCVGFIFDDDGEDEMSDPYWVSLFDKDGNEEWFSASEMIPWLPQVGERVVDPEDEDEFGTVVALDGEAARIKWDAYPRPQLFAVSALEPADEHEDVFTVGETVEFHSPFLAATVKAEVTEVDGSVIRAKFAPGFVYPDGYYPSDMFSKAA